MNKSLKFKVIVFILVWQVGFVRAEMLPDLGGNTRIGQQPLSTQGSVYIYGDQSMDNLSPVRVLGAVAKPGIHYVPPKTDLVTLISLAGGTTERAQMDKVSIKRVAQGGAKVLHVDLTELVEEAETLSPELFANDTVLVPVESSWVSDNTLRTVSLVTGVASIFLSIVVGVNNLSK